jgi:hypothetical protein
VRGVRGGDESDVGEDAALVPGMKWTVDERFGATTVNVIVDQPGNKDMGISGSGAQFHFGTAVHTVFSATSDCRMRASDSAPI